MTVKKNQHYVPQFYLRLFSVNEQESQIGLFYLTKEFFKQSVPLKSQAKEDYFYGADGYFEEELSKLESICAPHFKTIITANIIPKRQSSAYLSTLVFTIVMSNRTKDTAEKIKETTNKMAKELMSYDENLKDKIENIGIYPTEPAAMALATISEQIPICFDLKLKLVVNKTNLKFITSDNPVIKYNQFLEQRKHQGGNVGLATKGLQLFFPISPNHMLCFYDEWVYKIGDKSNDIITIDNIDDIEKLNYLQVLNCYDHLYFDDTITEYYLRTLFKKAKSKLQTEYSNLQKTHSYVDEEGQEHIFYHSYNYNLEVNLSLSFITQTKRAKRHILSDFAVQLRDESLRQKRR
ncbi:DUF4238 domain-containing protein [Sediminibacterium sp.]|uniref:DUF4238 domain-containing protein n=1 Tax=Sediminibacterium sp. TaxID=1917865 RepID=UPI002735CBC3|nr:DUF4238 domain-containing protein [Sediminibacterium sp.]MDP3393081.1 DUF4238 domain-containing protein [Sediminibacterium sp.]MDP3567683.1 DUF4238 domain-containing protein [Sediminibacterium sp.]